MLNPFFLRVRKNVFVFMQIQTWHAGLMALQVLA